MADNRIFLKCKVCGGLLFLGKRFSIGPYYWENYGLLNKKIRKDNPDAIFVHGGGDDDRPLENRLNAFFFDHLHIDESIEGKVGDDWPDNFGIVYESDDDFVYKKG